MGELIPLYIVGAGGFGREVEHIIRAVNAVRPTWRVEGFVDDAPSALNRARVQQLGHVVVGTVDELAARPPGHYVIGIGNGDVRRSIDARLSSSGWEPPTLVHPDATLGFDVELGKGVVICAGVRATTNIRIGRHVHLNANVNVGHDAEVEDYVTVYPLVAVSGGVVLRRGVTLGTHAAVLPGLEVGERSVVGAGAVVVRDVPPKVTVKGVPAR